ncbi:hypothetical protein AGDE_13931 [Angomonas deanei]|uniref:Uncharacterized protein n=1 Tax=Angomonas deanei TaxID=59799 RepID=A0A7G2CJK8_9TRYP|nr:hypothetical protein AGDE_13931 [Angomonas deanei]CAD2220040.1 hypothetical protein, conserved [Angomonas deanei]|eukprot:EPY21598.1 hypothetical protein AGDE_13931 [Angomonas deanei]
MNNTSTRTLEWEMRQLRVQLSREKEERLYYTEKAEEMEVYRRMYNDLRCKHRELEQELQALKQQQRGGDRVITPTVPQPSYSDGSDDDTDTVAAPEWEFCTGVAA